MSDRLAEIESHWRTPNSIKDLRSMEQIVVNGAALEAAGCFVCWSKPRFYPPSALDGHNQRYHPPSQIQARVVLRNCAKCGQAIYKTKGRGPAKSKQSAFCFTCRAKAARAISKRKVRGRSERGAYERKKNYHQAAGEVEFHDAIRVQKRGRQG